MEVAWEVELRRAKGIQGLPVGPSSKSQASFPIRNLEQWLHHPQASVSCFVTRGWLSSSGRIIAWAGFQFLCHTRVSRHACQLQLHSHPYSAGLFRSTFPGLCFSLCARRAFAPAGPFPLHPAPFLILFSNTYYFFNPRIGPVEGMYSYPHL